MTWVHNGFPLSREYENNNPRHVEVMANGTLHVSDAAKSDGGVYQCFVKNGVGQNETTVLVIVNGGSENDEEEEEGVYTDFYSNSAAAAGPDFQDLKAAPPSKPNVTQVGPTRDTLQGRVGMILYRRYYSQRILYYISY